MALARCLDSLVVPTRLSSHALHNVVLRCHDDRVEDGSPLLRHRLIMMLISCVVLLQKAAGFFF